MFVKDLIVQYIAWDIVEEHFMNHAKIYQKPLISLTLMVQI